MYYEINVSQHGRHVFATDERGLISSVQAKQLYDLLIVKFPVTEGYAVTVTKWETCGSHIDPRTLRG